MKYLLLTPCEEGDDSQQGGGTEWKRRDAFCMEHIARSISKGIKQGTNGKSWSLQEASFQSNVHGLITSKLGTHRVNENVASTACYERNKDIDESKSWQPEWQPWF